MPSIISAGAFLSLFNPAHWKADATSSSSRADCDPDDTDYSSDEDDKDDEDQNSEAKPTNVGPFSWPAWQERTGIMAPIFSPTPHAGTPAAWCSEEKNAAVWSFVTSFWALPQAKKVTYITRGTKDNNTVGRILYLDFMKGEYPSWSVNQVILGSLQENGVDPYTTLKARNVTKLPPFGQSQTHLAYNTIAINLFGPDALQQTGRVLKPAVFDCIYELTLSYWHRQAKTSEKEKLKIDTLKTEVEDGWKRLSDDASQGKKLTSEDFRAWLKHFTSLTSILKRRGDKESLNALFKQRDRIREMLAALGVGDGSKKRGEKILPKPLRNALKFLATEDQVQLLMLSLKEELSHSDPQNEYEDAPCLDPDLDLERMADLDWSEGVEEYQKSTHDKLWAMLGRSNETSIPFFNLKQDPESHRDPWTDEGQAWLRDPCNGDPLTLRWHQLVGVLKMVENAFLKKPTLLMDGVGLGKTIQVAAFVAILTWYREFFAAHGKFPGKFGGRKWDSPTGNIPDLPSVIVVPPSLVDQVTHELHLYFERGRFDVLPITGMWPKRQNWWMEYPPMCKNGPGRSLVITTPKALQSDFDAVLEADKMNPTSPPMKQASFAKESPNTMYGREFLAVIIDEAHLCRTQNKSYFASFGIMERSQTRIAMTATPIISRPQDVWNLGRLLHIDSFTSPLANEEYRIMESRLRTAAAKDRRQVRTTGMSASIIRATIKGKAVQPITSFYSKEMLRSVNKIRVRYAGITIRRTLRSEDCDGNRISGLEPFLEHLIKVKLYEREMDNLEGLAQDLIGDGTHKAAQLAGGSDFYLRVRRALIHPSCNPGIPWNYPSTSEEWKQHPSRKLDILIEILSHHLEKDNQPPLEVKDDKLVPSSRPSGSSPTNAPDKIVVYCEFPSAYVQISQVLKLNCIKTLQLDGTTPISQRMEIIEHFKNSTVDGPRVLIMSTVGLVGLNLPCANIMVKVTPQWSKQDDDQLVGRIYRHPQAKTVHVYSLIADHTQDVFLNHICFSKASIMEAFTNTTPSMKALFDQELGTAEDTNEEPETSSIPRATTQQKNNGSKSKGEKAASPASADPVARVDEGSRGGEGTVAKGGRGQVDKSGEVDGRGKGKKEKKGKKRSREESRSGEGTVTNGKSGEVDGRGKGKGKKGKKRSREEDDEGSAPKAKKKKSGEGREEGSQTQKKRKCADGADDKEAGPVKEKRRKKKSVQEVEEEPNKGAPSDSNGSQNPEQGSTSQKCSASNGTAQEGQEAEPSASQAKTTTFSLQTFLQDSGISERMRTADQGTQRIVEALLAGKGVDVLAGKGVDV